MRRDDARRDPGGPAVFDRYDRSRNTSMPSLIGLVMLMANDIEQFGRRQGRRHRARQVPAPASER